MEPPSSAERHALAQATAPAKAILLGEHAVVYGHPALAAPIATIGVRATVRPGDEPAIVITSRWPGGERAAAVAGAVDGGPEATDRRDPRAADDGDPMAVAVRATLAHLGFERLPRWRIDLASTIPPGRGLGSSAAVAVALVRAVAQAAGAMLDDITVSELALASERIVHGRPSGIDTACVSFARPIWFQSGAFRRALVGAALGLVVADSGRFSSTRSMVERVRAARDADPEGIDGVLGALGDLASSGTAALARGDGDALGQAMAAAHDGLRVLGVSTPELDALAVAAERAGAFGAKLAGSGGGGVVIAVCPPNRSARIARACRAAGAAWTGETILAADDVPRLPWAG